MLNDVQRDRLTVILVSPRNPLNIGAAARAMANFGFAHLTAVAPYEPHWREAKSAVGASDLLQNAKRTESLAEAIADCNLVLGTGTLEHRKPEQPVVALPELSPILQRQIERGGRVALVFGSEKRGLTREDLSLCHMLVEIPTDARQPSMNLGQAVAVCLYELNAQRGEPSKAGQYPAATVVSSNSSPPATAAELDLLADVVEKVLVHTDHSSGAMRGANRHDLHLVLRRLALTRRDTRRVLGLFRRILWRLTHQAGRARN